MTKVFLEDGQPGYAREYLEAVLDNFTETEAAIHAGEVLEHLESSGIRGALAYYKDTPDIFKAPTYVPERPK